MSTEDLFHKRKTYDPFLENQGEDIEGEDFLDKTVRETTDPMENAIRDCASFGHQLMVVRAIGS